MNSVTLTFAANGQQLVRTGCEKFAANTVNYIQAKFDLGEGWDGFDSVRAVWQTDFAKIATVLDNDGNCTVPQEVLKRVNSIMVNLVGSISDGTELTDRLTTYKVKALDVNGATNIDGTETTEVTPSQFEQFVDIVEDEVAKVTGMTAEATTLPSGSDATASYSDGVLTLGIPKGDRGEDGPIGPQGPQGEVGPEGPQGPKGEDAVVPWDDILPTDTASGAVASFPDGSDLAPAKSLKVSLDPIQSLHGYDKPWVGGAGKNKIPYPYNGDTASKNGVTVTVNNDGTITLNGTATATTYLWLVDRTPSFPSWLKPSTDYVVSGGNGAFNSDGKIQMILYGSPSWTLTENSGTTPADLSAYTHFAVVVQIANGSTYSNKKIYPQIELGSTATTWTPYSNICPISGWDKVNVSISPYEQTEKHTITGKNIFNAPNDASSILVACHIDANQSFVASANISCGIRYYDANKIRIDYWSTLPNSYGDRKYRVISSSTAIEYVEFYGSGNPTDLMIELGTTPSDYEPYGQSYTTTLGRTVYGGTLDVVSGELVVDRAMVDMGTLNWRYNGVVPNGYQYAVAIADKAVGETNFICSSYATGSPQTTLGYICGRASTTTVACNALESTQNDFIASVSGQTLVYELATPQTYQLTPQEVQTLLGQNNVWSEQGSVEVVYKADIQRWVEKKLT